MDYQLRPGRDYGVTVAGGTDHSLYVGMPYGGLPYDALTAKFEETDAGEDVEGEYDDYMRGELVDWSADKNLFEDEEPWKNVTAASGRLNARYRGGRGEENDAYMPELFLGETAPDPRGTAPGPDMKRYVDQEQARSRFHHFYSDASDFTTGGLRAPQRVIADDQRMRGTIKDRLMVFSHQLEGLVPGILKQWAGIPAKACQDGEELPEGADSTLRRARRDPQRKYGQQNVAQDTDFVVQYDAMARRKKTRGENHSRVLATELAPRMSRSDCTQIKKLARLIAQVATADKIAQDAEMREMRVGAPRKTAKDRVEDILLAIHQAHDAELKTSAGALYAKTGRAQAGEVRQHVVHSLPHVKFNAALMYKACADDGDKRRAQGRIVRDSTAAAAYDDRTRANPRRVRAQHPLLTSAQDSRAKDGTKTINYKLLKKCVVGAANARAIDGEDTAGVSAPSQTRRTGRDRARVFDADDVETTQVMGDSGSKERHAGAIGSKYMFGKSDVDRPNPLGA